MAKIQLGNFGQVLPEARQHQTSGGNVAGMLGNVVANFGAAVQQRNEAIERQKKGEDDILYTNIYAKAGADLTVLDDDVNMQLKQGVTVEDARMYREEGVQNILQKYQYDVPERYRDRFAGAMDAKAYESAAKVMPQFRASQQQSERVTLNETMQHALKSETKEEFQAVMRIGIDGSTLSDAEKRDLDIKARNTWDVDKSGRKLEGLFRSGDIEGIQNDFQ